jgi:hypothetical protein
VATHSLNHYLSFVRNHHEDTRSLKARFKFTNSESMKYAKEKSIKILNGSIVYNYYFQIGGKNGEL